MSEPQQDFLEAIAESSLSPEVKREWERVCLWDAISDYTGACGGDESDATVSSRRMGAVAKVERTMDLIRTAGQAYAIAAMEAGVLGKEGVYPNWVYAARQAIRHQNESLPWLPDLLKALGWESGTIHDALNAVHRLAAADKERRESEVE